MMTLILLLNDQWSAMATSSVASWVVERRGLIVALWVAAAVFAASRPGRLTIAWRQACVLREAAPPPWSADLATRFRSPYVTGLLLVVHGVPAPDTADGHDVLERIVNLVERQPGVGGVLSYSTAPDRHLLGRPHGTFVVVGLDPGSASPEALGPAPPGAEPPGGFAPARVLSGRGARVDGRDPSEPRP